jgi:Xaa-Pro aminopeptidase
MKTDLDRILSENHLDGMLVVGPAMHNSAMVYMTGGGHITYADLIKPCGSKGTLFFGAMERDEAAKSGLDLRGYSQYPMGELLRQAHGDRFQAAVLRYCKMFEDAGLTSGRVALYGKTDLGTAYSVISALQEAMPNITFVGDLENRVLQRAMMTKDAQEVERIRAVGRTTVEVVGRVAELLSGSKAKEDVLLLPDGQPLTIGAVKRKINLWLAECGVENPQGTIFAIGRDAGVPHSSGTPTDLIRLGQTIVFDIYPCEEGGGYYHDFTRTWCVGHAPDDVLALYEQVRGVFDKVSDGLIPGKRFASYQQLTCELFEQMGHPTILSTPNTEEGYVHSLGHGVGLNIHERPFSGSTALEEDVLAPGAVVTLEPGLYYPSKGMGVRLEDTIYVRPDGQFETLVDYPLDLVLPLKG